MLDPITAIGLASSLDQLAATATSIVCNMYKYYTIVRDAPKRSEELRKEIGAMSDTLKEIVEVVNSTSKAGTFKVPNFFDGSVAEMRTTLEEMNKRVQPSETKGYKRLLKWPFSKEENERLISKIERFMNTLSKTLDACGQRDCRQCAPRQLPLLTVAKAIERRLKILEWVSGNFSSRHKAVSKERAENSGTWFLESDAYQNWFKGIASNLLCYKGIPGAGKTFLTSLVIDEITRTVPFLNACVAYIYFDYKNGEAQTGEYVVRTILKQLLLPLNVIPSDLEAAYDDWCSRLKRPEKVFFTRQLLSTAAKFSSVYIILDALDECMGGNLEDIIDIIRQFKDSRIKVFCTFRPILSVNLGDRLDISTIHSIDAHDEDIRNYLSMRLNNEWRHDKCFLQEIIDQLAENANGKFLLVRFQLNYILDKEDPRDAMEALELGTIPRDMPDAYKEVLARIDKTKGRNTALKVLSWLFHAQRPMKMDEVREVISIRSGDKQLYPKYFIDSVQIIHYCQGLVDLDHNSGIVRFTHYTVQEFLNNKYLDELLTPTGLARVCLTYLTFDVFEHGPCPNKESFDQRLETYRFSDYAFRYWGFYVRGKGEEDSEIPETLLNLFKSSQKCNAIRQHVVWNEQSWWQPWWLVESLTWTPLHIIAFNGLSTIYKRFSSSYESGKDLELGAPDSRDDKNKTPLHLAAEQGYVDVAELLLHKGAEVGAQTKDGWTALHWAARGGHKGVVELLLSEGAEVGAQTKDGWTALHEAAWEGHKDVVELLLSEGAEVDAQSKVRWTALHEAAEKGHKDVVELLLSEGAEVGAQSKDGWTALHKAAWGGHKDVVELLLSEGAEVGAQTKDGWTALHRAAEGGYKDVVELLLSQGAEVGAQDKNGWTVLHEAALGGHKDVVELLLSKSAKVGAQTKDGLTALHEAALGGHKDVVELLLSKGAEVGAQTKDGLTALYWAAREGHKDVVELLERRKGITRNANDDQL